MTLNIEEIQKALDAKSVLLPALRQYQHNDCSGLLCGYDEEETKNIVQQLIDRVQELEHKLAGRERSEQLTKALQGKPNLI